MQRDPFKLDGTPYAQREQEIAGAVFSGEDVDLPDELSHALLEDPDIAAAVRCVEVFEHELAIAREVEEPVFGDPYFNNSEDGGLQLPVLIRVLFDFLREHPAIIKRLRGL